MIHKILRSHDATALPALPPDQNSLRNFGNREIYKAKFPRPKLAYSICVIRGRFLRSERATALPGCRPAETQGPKV